MNANQPEAMIQRYLDRVAEAIRDLPPEDRAEILTDLRAHIDEAVGDPASASEAEVRNVLERLGNPADMAREARERAPEQVVSQPSVYRRVKRNPGALEIAAIVLTFLFWPIGVVLAWLSERWLLRDKVIATAIPVLSGFLLVFVVLGGLFAYGGSATTAVQVMDEVRAVDRVTGAPMPPVNVEHPGMYVDSQPAVAAISRLVVLLGVLFGAFGGPLIAAVYLAIRIQPVEERLYPDGTQIRNGIPAGGAA